MTGRSTLQERLAADPGSALSDVAREAGVPPRAVIEALPEGTRHFGDGGFFPDAMDAIARWGDVTLVVPVGVGSREIVGPVPEAKIARGQYNLSSRLGADGEFRADRCAGIAFIERPVNGVPSASVVFLDVGGGILFEIRVSPATDEERREAQLAAFRALREAVVAEHIDD